MQTQISLLMVTTVQVTLEVFLLPFAEYFRAKGWRVDAVAHGATSSSKTLAAFDHCYDIEWTRKPWNLLKMYNAIDRIRTLVELGNYDIVHVHTPVAAFLTRFALRKAMREGRVKLVYTAHGFHFYKGNLVIKNFVFFHLEKIAAQWTDCLIVINEEDYHAALKMLPLERVCFMQGGVGVNLKEYDSGNFSQEEIKKIRDDLQLEASDKLFLMIAEFNPGKRHRDIIEALERIQNPQMHVAFAGVGRLFDRMKKIAKSKGLQKQVHFLGFREDIPLLIMASNVVILPSEREGLPRSIMESMALGVPIIGADTRGIRDLLSDGCGTIIPVGDVEALAVTMEKYMTVKDCFLQGALKAKSRMELYSQEKILLLQEQIYKKLLLIEG